MKQSLLTLRTRKKTHRLQTILTNKYTHKTKCQHSTLTNKFSNQQMTNNGFFRTKITQHTSFFQGKILTPQKNQELKNLHKLKFHGMRKRMGMLGLENSNM